MHKLLLNILLIGLAIFSFTVLAEVPANLTVESKINAMAATAAKNSTRVPSVEAMPSSANAKEPIVNNAPVNIAKDPVAASVPVNVVKDPVAATNTSVNAAKDPVAASNAPANAMTGNAATSKASSAISTTKQSDRNQKTEATSQKIERTAPMNRRVF